ncbi:hypothetical protein A6A25_40310 [Saccharothrix sp. CB00851]|nr:hypothetical protein A6A25_40310 [Saccharothrix sp. CB00851]
MAERIIAWVVELVPESGSAELTSDTDLARFAGFDSVAILQLLARAENEFDVSLTDQDDVIRAAGSVGTIADQVVRCAANRTDVP